MIYQLEIRKPRRRKDCKSYRGEDFRRTWPTDSMKQGSFWLTETEASSNGPAWICTRFSLYICHDCQCGVFVRFLTVGADVSLSHLSTPGTLFLLLGCLVRFQHEGFYLVLLYLVLFCLTDAGSFSEEEMECIWGKRCSQKRWRGVTGSGCIV